MSIKDNAMDREILREFSVICSGMSLGDMFRFNRLILEQIAYNLNVTHGWSLQTANVVATLTCYRLGEVQWQK